MKICVVGAGAIGAYMGMKLARAGADVTLIARGANLAAMRANGVFLEEDGVRQPAPAMRLCAGVDEPGAQDAVILAMKAHQVAPVAPGLHALLGPDTAVVTAQNGIPWWYFFRHGGPYEGRQLESVDPGGTIRAHIDPARVVGCIAYPACEIVAPGVIRHIEGNRFPLGEPDGADTARVRTLADLFRNAGFKTPVLSDIRSEIWLKLWGNLSFNPISALTHATLEDICRNAMTRGLAAAMMTEAEAIAGVLGVRFKVSLEKRIHGAEAVGAHKTSMLQDVEAGKAPELEALVGSVIELGRITGVPTPNIEAVYALVALLAQTLRRANGRVRVESA